MTELKTLKELPCAEGEDEFWHTNHSLPNTPRCIDESDLRTEAIKWIKMLRDVRKTLTDPRECMWNAGRQDIMIEFFDLTEEDLK